MYWIKIYARCGSLNSQICTAIISFKLRLAICTAEGTLAEQDQVKSRYL